MDARREVTTGYCASGVPPVDKHASGAQQKLLHDFVFESFE